MNASMTTNDGRGARVARRTATTALLGAGILLAGLAGVAGAEVVAEVGDRKILRSELEERIAPAIQRLEAERARLLEEGLRTLVDEKLLEIEAQRRGVSVDALLGGLAAEPVTDADVGAWYEANRERIRQPLERVRDQVREHLERMRRDAAVRELIAAVEGTTPVTSRLEPWRVELANGGAPVRGPVGAPVELTVFSDFECPWCRRLVPALESLEERYGDRLRLVFRHLPLTSIHPRAEGAALAAICAAEQEGFWGFHDALFEDPSRLDPGALGEVATAAGLDPEELATCRASERPADRLAADVGEAGRLGISSTPSVFVNGRPVVLAGGTPPEEQIAAVVDDELARSAG